jgi:hypothetical protein
LSSTEKTNWGLVAWYDFATPATLLTDSHGVNTLVNTNSVGIAAGIKAESTGALTTVAGLVSWWDLEEASGTRFDSHGSNNLTSNNSVTQADGVAERAGDGNVVSVWTDQSGNGRNASQATFADRGIVRLATQNSLPVVRIDGVDDFMSAGNISALNFERTDPFTVWAVIRPRSVAADGVILAKSLNAGTFAGWYAIYEHTGSNIRFLLQQTSAPIYAGIKGSTVIVVDTPYVVICRSTGSGDVTGMSIWINGVAETPTTISNNLSGTIQGAAAVTVGSRDNGGVPFNGDICECGVFPSSLSNANMLLMSNYLKNKWGV